MILLGLAIGERLQRLGSRWRWLPLVVGSCGGTLAPLPLHAQANAVYWTIDSLTNAAPIVSNRPVSTHYAGRVVCGTDGPTHEQFVQLAPLEQANHAAHEAIHQRQLLVYRILNPLTYAMVSDCQSVLDRWANDIGLLVESEAEAFCGGLKAADVPRAWWRGRVVRASAWWAQWSTIGFDAARAAFERWCGT